jgi:LAO/AO transport system kinase
MEYQNALHLFPPTGTGWFPPVLTCSALTGTGIERIWPTVREHQQMLAATGHTEQRRQEQQLTWFRSLLRQQIDARFYAQPGLNQRLMAVEAQVRAGTLLPGAAVDLLLNERGR